MTDRKQTGSYYTPNILSDFLTRYVFDNYIKLHNESSINVLEPSCGDGKFIASLLKMNVDFNKHSISLYDINNIELQKASELFRSDQRSNVDLYNNDFLEDFSKHKNKCSLIIGNPPYIRKKNMSDKQIINCEKVHKLLYEEELNPNVKFKIKNVWTAFVEASVMCLKKDGVFCMVLPADIMQVNYTKYLRWVLSSQFDKVDIFAFNELVFNDIQQDVVAIIGVKKLSNTSLHGISFYQVNKLEDLLERKFTRQFNNIHRTNLDKWTNYILSDYELNSIHKLRKKFETINFYCDEANVGIVTAANNYFILNKEELKFNKLSRYTSVVKPILSKGENVKNLVNFSISDYQKLKNSNAKVCFLKFKNITKNKFSKDVQSYLNNGESLKIDKRYKMTKRQNWYHVPSDWECDAFFVKRCHLFPRMIVNEANVLATDSFYKVNLKKEFNVKNFVFSFYNSLTFILCELEGRYYGGGVLELTPNEFKNIYIPYCHDVTDSDFYHLDSMIRNDADISEILKFTNSIIFKDVDIDLIYLEKIRNKLVNRRIKASLKSSLNNIVSISDEYIEKNLYKNASNI
ncbi:Eco57I restriction-modification methylase domain-containing protein [Marinicella sp. W31]|uniref:Eco57I restriction-modification methylase domain-containing protein n=1 Tax=Marinicella sp. W31 TaxID=3023713 RepID=UPI003757B571